MTEATDTAQEPLTVLAALRLVWEAEHYPILDNGDAAVGDLLDQEALALARNAVSEPNDPPGLRHCVTALLGPALSRDDRDTVLDSSISCLIPNTPGNDLGSAKREPTDTNRTIR